MKFGLVYKEEENGKVITCPKEFGTEQEAKQYVKENGFIDENIFPLGVSSISIDDATIDIGVCKKKDLQ